ncbi:MAG: magnesium/cobalt transporter CorA [candidate division Zixibacteria bacterium]|nr:magnesium/cobalt transporter CorA [candidate division Zixibacteria bacterium]
MVRLFKKMARKAGLPPGTLVQIDEAREEKVKITVIDYDAEHFVESVVEDAAVCLELKDKPTVTWVNVDGIHRVDVLEDIGGCFGLHPLVLEDIANTDQRPKTEDFGDYLYIVLKMLNYDEESDELTTEQLSLVLGPNYVLSFQEREGDAFDAVRDRLRNSKGRIRTVGADYLAYALVDAVVDNYFVILEQIGERVGLLEEKVAEDPKPETLHNIHNLKREMIILRKSVWPLREVVNALGRGDTPLVRKTTRVFLKDVYDHTIQVIDAVETYRDVLAGMLDLYLSTVSNRMNEVMKVLTVIATIFIPLTFIAGIYGMNFQFMPELSWNWSYPLVWVVMAAVAVTMLIFFKRRKWL